MPEMEILPASRQDSSELLSKLAHSLELISKGDPLVSLRTELNHRFAAVETRFLAIDKATDLQHQDLVRVPTDVMRATENLKLLIEAKLNGTVGNINGLIETKTAQFTERFTGSIEVVNEKITSLANVTTQQFKSIDDKFAEKDKAVSVGLSAQKESAAAQQDSNNTATRKMEDNFTKLLDQGRELLTEVRRNTELQINDIKSRLDKGEGRSSFADPDMAVKLIKIEQQLGSLTSTMSEGAGRQTAHKDYTAILLAIGAIAVALFIKLQSPIIDRDYGPPKPQLQRNSGPALLPLPSFSLRVAGYE